MMRPDVFAMDVSALQYNLNRVQSQSEHCPSVRPIFDAIVCDPPYGVRARSQKAGIRESKLQKPKKEVRESDEVLPYFSQKEHFDFVELHEHLLHVASILLRPGGRLVFLFFTDEEASPEKNKFPEHPAFDFERSSKDQLTKFKARHLLTLRKKFS